MPLAVDVNPPAIVRTIEAERKPTAAFMPPDLSNFSLPSHFRDSLNAAPVQVLKSASVEENQPAASPDVRHADNEGGLWSTVKSLVKIATQPIGFACLFGAPSGVIVAATEGIGLASGLAYAIGGFYLMKACYYGALFAADAIYRRLNKDGAPLI